MENQTHEKKSHSGTVSRRIWVQTRFLSTGVWHQLEVHGFWLGSDRCPTHTPQRLVVKGSCRRNFIPCECLSPSFYYKNRRVARLRPDGARIVLSAPVKRDPAKPLITTCRSVWLRVGRVMARGGGEGAKKQSKKRYLRRF